MTLLPEPEYTRADRRRKGAIQTTRPIRGRADASKIEAPCIACGRLIHAGQPRRPGPVHAYCTAKAVQS